MIYKKFNLKIIHPPPYQRQNWHCAKANVDHMRRAKIEFSWERSFERNSVNEKINIFNAIIKYIISKQVIHETVTSDDRDQPWLSKNIKQLSLEKSIQNLYLEQ